MTDENSWPSVSSCDMVNLTNNSQEFNVECMQPEIDFAGESLSKSEGAAFMVNTRIMEKRLSIVDFERYGSFDKLIRVITYV